MTIGIIGGGIMGLVIASRLSRLGHLVHVMESEGQLGGLATWFDYKDFTWDKFYHVILQSDQHLLQLIDELNLRDHLRWTTTKTGFLYKGRHISMNNHWELITFPALSVFQKMRLVSGILACQFVKNPEKLHDIKAKDWLPSLFGKDVYTTIWEPLLESKFGMLKDQIPASIMYSTIMRYRSTRKSASGKEMMGYLSGGLKILIEKLASDIISNGGKIQLRCKVSSIEELHDKQMQDKKIVVNATDGRYFFNQLINTLPTTVFQKIAPNIQGLLDLQKLPQFLGVICLSLVYKKAFSPFYVTNLIDKGFPFTGMIEPSNVASSEEFNGKHLLMLPRYDVPNSIWFDKSDREIRDIFIEKLTHIWPDFKNGIKESFIQRARLVQALWIDSPTLLTQPRKSESGAIWSINSELAKGETLSNNGIVEIANDATTQFLNARGFSK